MSVCISTDRRAVHDALRTDVAVATRCHLAVPYVITSTMFIIGSTRQPTTSTTASYYLKTILCLIAQCIITTTLEAITTYT